MTTERLYYTDSYLTVFGATVVGRAEDGRRIYLDRTAFYPTSGGQPNDLGRLGEARVVDVVDEDDRIAHLLDAPLRDGAVEGVVDWDRRFDHMQQHTGQHLLSAVLVDLFAWETTSVHFGAGIATLDLATGALSTAQLRQAEDRANRVVTENRPVTVGFEEAVAATGLRKPVSRAGALRIVSIADLDRSACGGTHVRRTGEIGPILLRRAERVKQQVRLEFLCGMRAIRRARADLGLLQGMAGSMSASMDELPALIEGQRSALKAADLARRAALAELGAARARELFAAQATGAGPRVILLPGAGSMDELRAMAQAVAALPQAVLIGAVSSPPALLLATSADSGLDAAALLREVVAAAGGRGGGSARVAQGTIPDAVRLEGALQDLARRVRG